MSVDNTINHDRSIAIKTALGAFLDPQQTAQAIGLWQEKYASQATFSVQYFVLSLIHISEPTRPY